MLLNKNIDKLFHNPDDHETGKLRQLFKKINQKQIMRQTNNLVEEIKKVNKIKRNTRS